MSRVLVLFAGAADGWGGGLQRCGYAIVALAESDPARRAVLRKHHPEAMIYDDVRQVSRERLLADLGYLPDVVVGSPPCQDISSANNGKAQGVDGARSGLFFDAIRIIGEVRPDWYALENSAFVKTRGYDRIKIALEEVGYACWPSVVGAIDAGYFHLRKRAWLAGVDAAYAQGEPMGTAGQPWAAASASSDADALLADPARRHAHRGRQPRAGKAEEGASDTDGLQRRPAGKLRQRCADAGNGDPAAACEAEFTDGQVAAGDRAAGAGKRQAHARAGRGAVEDDAHRAGQRRARLDGPGPRGRPTEVGAGLPDFLAAIERAARACGLGGRSRLAEHYRMADGLRSGLARLCISAYGDALVPDIAEAFGRVMPQLLAELGA